MGRCRGRKNHPCWCPETVMISTCLHSCCVYYWLREMSANTGCYYCAWMHAWQFCHHVEFLCYWSFALSYSPPPSFALTGVTALSSVLKHSACLHLQGYTWGSCRLKCVIDFGRDRCNWVSQCKSWNNLAFTVAHHDHELRALLTAFLVSVKRVLAICW